jgi:hypothetical protein
MNFKGAIGVSGKVRLLHKRGEKVISDDTFCNTITTAGIAEVAGLINGSRTGAFTYLALGDSGTEATAADTALTNEITAAGLARVAATCTRTITDTANDTAQLLHTFTATNTQAVREVGIFDSAAVGIMLGHHTFPVKNMEEDDVLQITYKVDVD